jgi:hypothetical protein
VVTARPIGSPGRSRAVIYGPLTGRLQLGVKSDGARAITLNGKTPARLAARVTIGALRRVARGRLQVSIRNRGQRTVRLKLRAVARVYGARRVVARFAGAKRIRAGKKASVALRPTGGKLRRRNQLTLTALVKRRAVARKVASLTVRRAR